MPERILVGDADDYLVTVHDIYVVFAFQRVDGVTVQASVLADLHQDIVDHIRTVEGRMPASLCIEREQRVAAHQDGDTRSERTQRIDAAALFGSFQRVGRLVQVTDIVKFRAENDLVQLHLLQLECHLLDADRILPVPFFDGQRVGSGNRKRIGLRLADRSLDQLFRFLDQLSLSLETGGKYPDKDQEINR